MHKEIYKVYLKTGNDIKVMIDPQDYDHLTVSAKKKAILFNLNTMFGTEIATAVKYVCRINAEMPERIMKV